MTYHRLLLLQLILLSSLCNRGMSKLADRSRVVKERQRRGVVHSFYDNGRPLEGPRYRSNQKDAIIDTQKRKKSITTTNNDKKPLWNLDSNHPTTNGIEETNDPPHRELSSQLSGCCYNYQSYSAEDLCYMYGNDCQSGETPSHDSGDGDCSQDGLSFIGISFSVNTASGNPYSYHLNDQFPMENIIDRDYEYVMSLDEDGWLVGGGYKTFDYSGKMPYVYMAQRTAIVCHLKPTPDSLFTLSTPTRYTDISIHRTQNYCESEI